MAVNAPPELVAFVRREQPRLVRAVDLLLGDHAVAEEIAQEALVRAASRWEQVSQLDSPGGWAHRVAINLATSQARRRRVARRARARLARGDVAPAPDTAAALDVRDALGRLPPAQRRVLVLRHVLEWTATEIAALDRSSPDAVRQRLRRARTALGVHLGLEADEEETSDVR